MRGRRVLDVIVEPLRAFYEAAFRESYRTEKQWEHSYECSSPALYRRFRLRILPLVQDAAIVGINFLEAEYPHGADRPAMPADQHLYRREDGFMAMCANCRRTRRAGGPPVWDWVPSFVEHWPTDVTHGLCPVCSMHFFPDVVPPLRG